MYIKNNDYFIYISKKILKNIIFINCYEEKNVIDKYKIRIAYKRFMGLFGTGYICISLSYASDYLNTINLLETEMYVLKHS